MPGNEKGYNRNTYYSNQSRNYYYYYYKLEALEHFFHLHMLCVYKDLQMIIR